MESKAKIVLRFMGFMWSVEPDMICWTIILFAFSDGWNASQNAYKSRLRHKLESGVQSPMPLNGPCPQQAILDVVNPAQRQQAHVMYCFRKK